MRRLLQPIVSAIFLSFFLLTVLFAKDQPATVIRGANLRAGPSTTYAIVGGVKAGDTVTVVGSNDAGTWYKLDNGKWIASFLVSLDDGQTIQDPVVDLPAQNCEGGCKVFPTWCAPPIKGNVSYESREKIYHVYGQKYYEATVINPRYGERWFCTEGEAQRAGWRRARTN